MKAPLVALSATSAELTAAAAKRLAELIVAAQEARGAASIVLTGGGTGTGVLKALAARSDSSGIDWSNVDIWWGDERFVEASSPDRNDVQARDALLDVVPVDPARVHPFPASDGEFGDDPDAAAQWYAEQLIAAAEPKARMPRFDVLMLGVGEEGHTASIFPNSPAAYDERPVCAVRDCPKPPPTRLTLTFPSLEDTAVEVWMMTAGAAKADAVSAALQGASPDQTPAAGPRGIERTIWFLDEAAASKTPPESLRSLADSAS